MTGWHMDTESGFNVNIWKYVYLVTMQLWLSDTCGYSVSTLMHDLLFDLKRLFSAADRRKEMHLDQSLPHMQIYQINFLLTFNKYLP